MAATKTDFSRWEKVRAKGALRFVLLYGVLGWGVTTAIVFTGILWLLPGDDPARLLPLVFTLFPLGGLAWGASMWWFLERAYRRREGG